jgi:hypothetical protein
MREVALATSQDAAGVTGMAEGNVRRPTARKMHALRRHSDTMGIAGEIDRTKTQPRRDKSPANGRLICSVHPTDCRQLQHHEKDETDTCKIHHAAR